MAREGSNLSQAGSEKSEKQEKEKQPEKPTEKSPEKPESVMDKVKKLQEVSGPRNGASVSFSTSKSHLLYHRICSFLLQFMKCVSYTFFAFFDFYLFKSAAPMSPMSPVHTSIPSGMDEGTEQEYLKLQVKDLSEKLETLRFAHAYGFTCHFIFSAHLKYFRISR